MNSKRLREIKVLIAKTLNEINQNDPEWEELEIERKPYTANVGDADPDDTGGMTTDDIEVKVVELWKQLAAEKPSLDVVHKILDSPELNTPYAKAILSHGDSNDVVKVTDTQFEIGKAEPTQNQIFWTKSVLFSCANKTWGHTAIESLKNKAHGNSKLKVNVAKMGDRVYILDGHHRWSGQFAFGEQSHTLSGLNFDFGGEQLNRALAALQVAIASNTKIGTKIPSATGGKKGQNVFEASEKELAGSLIDKFGILASSIDPKAPGDPIMGDEWLEKLLTGAPAEIKKWLEGAMSSGSMTKASISFDKLAEDYGDNGVQTLLDARITGTDDPEALKGCALRKTMAWEIARRYKQHVTPADAKVATTERKDMPQLDGKTGGQNDDGEDAETSPQEIADQFKAGNVNHDIEFHLPDLPNDEDDDKENVDESIDLNRWNKLAGLLKD